MTKAIRIYEIGGPEVLKWEDVAVGEPGAGEVRLKHTAIGLNYIEVWLFVSPLRACEASR